MSSSLLLQVQLLVYRSLSHHLLLPWPNVGEKDQNWESRGLEHQHFTAQLAKDYFGLVTSLQMQSNKEQGISSFEKLYETFF